MRSNCTALFRLLPALLLLLLPGYGSAAGITLKSDQLAAPLQLDGFYIETGASNRVMLPSKVIESLAGSSHAKFQMPGQEGQFIEASLVASNNTWTLKLSASPKDESLKWGMSVAASPEEYFTGLMERVVDGPQQASWKPGITEAMNLRGQKVDLILKPTTSVYAPFYISSRGYGLFVRGTWPGTFDFCVTNSDRVNIEWEGPSFEVKFYASSNPARLVTMHASDAGLPFLPPKWMFSPWRWRDEHKQRQTYYDGTPATGPFNSEITEDVLMMKAFGIPCGVYWVDRPWGPGRLGYDDFEIDYDRLPNFEKNVQWLEQQGINMVLWIGPFYQGTMETNALKNSWNLPGQPPQRNNYPLVDFSNPQAKAYWQEGVERLLKMGVAGFKLDRAEENIPDGGPYKIFDGRSLRENRNDYPVMYLKATYEVASKARGKDFVLMPRAAFTGSSPYGVFWGGDIAGTQEGLRASIIAVQKSAVLGYPNWGSDTCGYSQQLMEQEVCARWLGFSCFTPIMEVGPTRNVAFWNLPREPKYDSELIAIWRVYARLHQRLADYGYKHAQEAAKTGMPIVRPLFLLEPKAPQAWSNWWTYAYGSDIVVSPIWEKNKRKQEVYLPSGSDWRDAWDGKYFKGGQTYTVEAPLHQLPIFVKAGSSVDLGDLHREYAEAKTLAAKKPNLAQLEEEVKSWIAKQQATARNP